MSSIAVYEERRIGEILNVSFGFLRRFFRPIGLSLLYFAAPFAVLSQVIGSLAVSDIQAGEVNLLFFVAQIPALIAILATTAIVMGGLRLYQDEGEEAMSALRIGREAVDVAFRIILGYLVYIILAVGVVIVIGGILGGAYMVSPIVTSMGFLLWIPFAIYFLVKMYVFIPDLVMKDDGIIEAMRRSFRLTSGYVWVTIGLFIITAIIAGVLTIIFSIPSIVVEQVALVGLMENVTVLRILAGVISLGGIVIQVAFPAVVSVFHYWNLTERHEMVSLQQDVDAIGAETPSDREVGSESEGASPEPASGNGASAEDADRSGTADTDADAGNSTVASSDASTESDQERWGR